MFKEFIALTMKEHIPNKLTSTRTNIPWFNRGLKRMCKVKRRRFKRAKKVKKSRDWESYVAHKKATASNLKAARWDHLNGILQTSLEEKNTKLFYWYTTQKNNKNKIEKIQRKAARFVLNNFRRKASVSEMLHDLGWQSLDSRRQDQRLVLFYKIINGLASVETEDILKPADSRTKKNHSFKFKHFQANCDSYRFSFFPVTI